MTSPVDGYIQLPLDTANTGKKRRTQTRVIGANTTHEDFVVPVSKRNIIGNYLFHAPNTVLPITAQDGITTGLIWVFNPTASTTKLAIKRIITNVHFTASAIDLAIGFLRTHRFTYTGTASGTVATAKKLDSADAATSALGYSSSTGLTVTVGDALYRHMLPVMYSASDKLGPVEGAVRDYKPESEDEEFILNAGEGIVIYSASNLTTANRTAIANIYVQEFD